MQENFGLNLSPNSFDVKTVPTVCFNMQYFTLESFSSRTTDAQWSLFSSKSQTFGLGHINFGAFGVFSSDLSASILVLWIPCPCFPLMNHYLYKKLNLYIHYTNPKYSFGIGIWIWAAKNWGFSHRVFVVRGSRDSQNKDEQEQGFLSFSSSPKKQSFLPNGQVERRESKDPVFDALIHVSLLFMAPWPKTKRNHSVLVAQSWIGLCLQ